MTSFKQNKVVERCPVCIENPEDYGNCNMCYRCGALVCQPCSILLAKNHQWKCPSCREDYAKRVEDILPLLQELHTRELSREDGSRQHRVEFIEASLGILMVDYGINYSKAKEYLERTASRGFMGSICNLGHIYRLGLGTKKNPKKALKLYSESSVLKQSIWAMSDMYRRGEGVEKDKKYAVSLEKIADTIDEYSHCKTGKPFYF